MSKTAHQNLASTLHEAMAEHVARANRHFRAEVTDDDPLTVEMVGSKKVLDEDDLVLSQAVDRYDDKVGIEIGDDVLLEQHGEDYVITQVISDNDTKESGESSTWDNDGVHPAGSRIVIEASEHGLGEGRKKHVSVMDNDSGKVSKDAETTVAADGMVTVDFDDEQPANKWLVLIVGW